MVGRYSRIQLDGLQDIEHESSPNKVIVKLLTEEREKRAAKVALVKENHGTSNPTFAGKREKSVSAQGFIL